MINDCNSAISIIKNYTKMTDNQLQVLVDKGYEDAILEQARRESRILLCQMPDRTWAATAESNISRGFPTKQAARDWVKAELRKAGWLQINKHNSKGEGRWEQNFEPKV